MAEKWDSAAQRNFSYEDWVAEHDDGCRCTADFMAASGKSYTAEQYWKTWLSFPAAHDGGGRRRTKRRRTKRRRTKRRNK